MGDASKFFEENILGLSDPEKCNLYGGLSEKSDELSALHDEMNKLSEMADELSALHDERNRLEAALGKIGRDMRELRKSVRVARAAPNPLG
jgi:chromosome segregation ATPase